jgi:hypothetical protein
VKRSLLLSARLSLLPILLLIGPAAPAAAVDLTGTWHVLVHYKDSQAHNADAERWEDRVWVFDREGDRLRWRDYPIVVLNDESNRFDRLGTNKASRRLVYWTPTPEQQKELAEGPRVNARGSKSKSLRGSDAAGWKSTSAQQKSMQFVTYEEHWSIDGLPEKPVFTRTDVLGGGGAEESEGMTRFATSEADGDAVLRGSYERDGRRKGTFTLTRVGAVRNLEPASDEEQRQRMRDHFIDQYGREIGEDAEEQP